MTGQFKTQSDCEDHCNQYANRDHCLDIKFHCADLTSKLMLLFGYH